MKYSEVETYTPYHVEFIEPQWLRCLRGPSRTVSSATLVFFRVKWDSRLRYRSHNSGWGYPVYDGMIENIKSIEPAERYT
jgi:hypothetical protein